MKKGWENRKIGEVIDHLRTGLNPRTHFKLNTPDADGYYITVRELKGFAIEPDEKTDKVNNAAIKRINERSNLRIGDVLFSGTGTIGKTALVSVLPTNWNIKEGVYAMTPKHSILDSKYFIYYIGSGFFLRLVNEKAAGTGVRSIPMKELVKLPISVPPISEQQAIVNYLDSAFAKIDAMKANAEKALDEAKALFQASLKEMLEPKEGWEKKKIDEVCAIARGGSPRPIKEFITNDPKGLNWIKIGDTDMGGKYIYSTKEKIKPEGLKRSRWVEEDDFLLSNSMSFGRPYILKTNGCIHDGWLVLRDYQKYLNIDFFYYVLSSENVQRQFRTKAQGSTVSNLNTDRVASVIIYIPPLKEQQSIVATLDSIKSKVDHLQENYNKISQECDTLKQAILRQVFE